LSTEQSPQYKVCDWLWECWPESWWTGLDTHVCLGKHSLWQNFSICIEKV